MNYSIIQYCSEHEKYECGYCKKRDSNYSHGLWAHTMMVRDYQDLIDRGWRRSGKYCYKPSNSIICCPMYTIRCRVLEFKATKSQKKVLKRFNKYLMGGDNQETTVSKALSNSNNDMKVDDTEGREHYVESTRTYQNIDLSTIDFKQNKSREENDVKECASSSKIEVNALQKEKDKMDAGPDPTKAPCRKAKVMRRERRMEKMRQKGIHVNQISNSNKEKQIEDYLKELPDDIQRKLKLTLVRTSPPSEEWNATSKQTYEVYVRYQTIVHGDRPEKWTETKFRQFLVDSPLLEEHSETGPPCGYGSFHQQYWLDDQLVAVGVIDILPKCISSVYFFYDPHYMFLTLGTYGALREIALTRHFHSLSSEIEYYYMGYYIHSCPKMRYKGNYCPSDLLCSETYKWFDIRDCLPKLTNTLYTRFNPDMDGVDEFYPSEDVVMYIPMLVNRKIILYNEYIKKYGEKNSDIDIEEFKEYCELVGSRVARRLVLVK